MRRLILAVFLTGCGPSVQYSLVNPPPHAMTARTPESVEILTAAPARGHVDVGMIAWPAQSASDDKAEILRQMRYDAAQRGCDGLVMGADGKSASCIVYQDSGPGPAPKPMQEAPQHGY